MSRVFAVVCTWLYHILLRETGHVPTSAPALGLAGTVLQQQLMAQPLVFSFAAGKEERRSLWRFRRGNGDGMHAHGGRNATREARYGGWWPTASSLARACSTATVGAATSPGPAAGATVFIDGRACCFGRDTRADWMLLSQESPLVGAVTLTRRWRVACRDSMAAILTPVPAPGPAR